VELVLALILLLAVAAFVMAPLRHRPEPPDPGQARESQLAELEAQKEAKYREIRDTELDRATGKLSDDEFTRQDAELRNDALEILDQIDRTRKRDDKSEPV
jgi:flagellar biosynthesis/type III secretory pathway M-ring protein FliF/YscJ